MKWQDIEISNDEKYFLYLNKKIFDKEFKQVMKFHEP